MLSSSSDLEIFNDVNLKNLSIEKKYYDIIIKKYSSFYKHIISLHIGSNNIHPVIIKSIENIKKKNEKTLLFITINNQFSGNIQSIISKCSVILDNLEKDIIIVSVENKGMDIGGFYITIHLLNTMNISYNIITKIHTKTNTRWLIALLKPYLINYNSNITNLYNSAAISLGSNKIAYPIDSSQINTIDFLFQKVYNINIKSKFLDKENLFIRNAQLFREGPKKLNPPAPDSEFSNLKKLYDFSKNNYPVFFAGTIGTFKKIVIDKLTNIIPISLYKEFGYGYLIDDGVTVSIPHIIERVLGYIQFYIAKGQI
jgi:hypothetical protein